ncbi:MAG: tetratricopeptide repeat protein [Rhodospirillaceae bacterium]|nr:tetratricopeptide repeat protein [Rhodospirillaceae bacterium]
MSQKSTEPLSRAFAAQAAGRIDEAAALFEQTLARDPQSVPALVSLGQILQGRGDLVRARDLYARALKIERGIAGLHNNHGAVLVAEGDDTAAIPAFAAALTLEPANQLFRYNLASALDRAGRPADAVAHFKEMLAREPGHLQALLGRASALFALGRWDEAWADYAHRHRQHWPEGRRPLPSPPWCGEPLAGRKLLLAYEQGLGEQIMFASHIPELRALGASLVVECEARLVPLFARSFPEVTVVPWQEPWRGEVTTGIDFHVTIADAARRLRRGTPGTPAVTGYLKADPLRAAALRARYGALAAGRRIVGLSWHSAGVNYGTQKSMPLAALKPLLARDDLFCVSLQYGAVPDTAGLHVDVGIDATNDLDAAAAQAMAMDEVITVSNTTAHMAAALGKPVKLMLPKAAGRIWYWFSGHAGEARATQDRASGAAHPWYTTLRFYVQGRQGVWDDVVAQVSADLGK